MDDLEGSESIGTVTHYFPHLQVAAVTLRAALRRGDRVHIRGHTTDLVQVVDSIEVAHTAVDEAEHGQEVGIHVDDRVREHDRVYRA
jgi:translation elongation factor EF-Tu-like GTPase